jgi:hypothetical protein
MMMMIDGMNKIELLILIIIFKCHQYKENHIMLVFLLIFFIFLQIHGVRPRSVFYPYQLGGF